MGPEVPRLSRRALRDGRGAPLTSFGLLSCIGDSGTLEFITVIGGNSDGGNNIRMILPSQKSIFLKSKLMKY